MILRAFYDLGICTVTFDFLSFLLRAEMARREAGAASIHMVFVPGPDDGFRAGRLGAEQSRWRLRNMLVAGCALMPSIRAISLCATREEAAVLEETADCTFPAGYTLAADGAAAAERASIEALFFAGIVVRHIRGEAVPELQASAAAHRAVADWIAAKLGGRRPVVITLRQYGHDIGRNSVIENWAAFAQGLDPDRYAPVIVRDTDAVFSPVPEALRGLPEFEPASLDLDLRVALYEAAFLNMMVNNGPVAICYLSPRIRYLMCKVFAVTNMGDAALNCCLYGIPLYGQVPMATEFQRLVWEDDTLDSLERSFAGMAARIEAAEADGSIAERAQRQPIDAAAAYEIALALHRVGWVDAAVSIYHHLFGCDPDNPRIGPMLGLALYHQGRYAEARPLLEAAAQAHPGDPDILCNLANLHRAERRFDIAAETYEAALAREPGFAAAWLNLARVRSSLGAWQQADDAFGRAWSLGERGPDMLRDWAAALECLGDGQAATERLLRVIDAADARVAAEEEAGMKAHAGFRNIFRDRIPYLILPEIGRDRDQRRLPNL
ncbi:MAG: tetratricopeptide repeat protein [Alphaproteobacteria bacterium]